MRWFQESRLQTSSTTYFSSFPSGSALYSNVYPHENPDPRDLTEDSHIASHVRSNRVLAMAWVSQRSYGTVVHQQAAGMITQGYPPVI